jgi:hypothetical protein
MRRPASRSRIFLLTSLLMGSGLTGALPGAAQQSPGQPPAPEQPGEPFNASPYLPLGHWAYPIVEYWIAAGRVSSLSPFVKPYRRIDVARALADIGEGSLGAGERGWLNRLRSEFAGELSRLGGDPPRPVGMSLELGAGAQYASQTHRDLLRPELDGEFSDSELLEDLRLELEGQAGPVVGAFRLTHHGIYRNDAQFPGGDVVPKTDPGPFDVTARSDEAYLELQSRYARLSFGRMYRNWGAPDLPGFLRSGYAYSEEEIGYRIGTDRVFLIGSFASYTDFKSDTAHYVAIHRLEVRPSDDLMLALSQSSVHGGPGQNVDLALINPVSVWQFARRDDDPFHNKSGQLDVWWRTGLGLNLYGSFLADATKSEESKLGGSFGMEVSRLAPGLLLRVNLSAVQSLTYRAKLLPPSPWEEYSVERIGIGWDKTETTIRPALAGRWLSGGRIPVELEWDLGVNFITDYDHVAGDDRTELVGTLGLMIRSPRWVFDSR